MFLVEGTKHNEHNVQKEKLVGRTEKGYSLLNGGEIVPIRLISFAMCM